MKQMTIAIDGPAASGKSTTARLLAQKLGYLYIDTGAMYRAATLAVLDESIEIQNEDAVVDCVRRHAVSLQLDTAGQRTLLDGRDVTSLLRTPEINRAISVISSYAGVRSVMVEQQRRLAADGGIVMDGRDIGTVVLPQADLKIFMIASLQERARRRMEELKMQGVSADIDHIMAEIARRDELDASRSEAPLKKAVEARELDTSNMSIAGQVDAIFSMIANLT
jgi:cytidylate kinase